MQQSVQARLSISAFPDYRDMSALLVKIHQGDRDGHIVAEQGGGSGSEQTLQGRGGSKRAVERIASAWEHLEQSETTMMEEAQAAATRFRCSGTKGLPCTASATGLTFAARALELLDPLLHSRPVTHATMLGPNDLSSQ